MAEGGQPVEPPKLRVPRVMQALHLAKRALLRLFLGAEREEDHQEAVSVVEVSGLDQISIEGVVDPGEDLGEEEGEASHHL